MKAAFRLLAQRLRVRAVDQLPEEDSQLSCFMLSTSLLPTAILYVPKDKESICIIEWMYLPHTPPRNLFPCITAVADLFFKARHRALQLTGKDIDCVFFPFKQEESERLLVTSPEFQVAFAGFLGTVLHNPPKDKCLQLFSQISYKLTSCFSLQPLSHAITVFTDGSPTRGVVTWQMPDGSWSSKFTENQSSAQRSELAAVILAFQLFAQEDFNLIVDTQYVYKLLLHLPLSYLSPAINRELYGMFSKLQQLIQGRSYFCYVAHIRSHTGFPGFLAEGNARADGALKQNVFSLFDDPILSHHTFHQSAKVLHKMFSIPVSQARDIVSACPSCCKSPINFPFDAVNPRGTQANQTWQMDVTHVPSLGPFNKLHLTVDTYSGFIWATPMKGETSRHVIQHCIRTFAVMGKPLAIKTDNGLSYCSHSFSEFCNLWGIKLSHGIPFNSTGQAIVERAHLTFKSVLYKQTEGRGISTADIPAVVAKVLYTLNFLFTPHNRSHTPVELHFRTEEQLPRPLVSYRKLPDPEWKGPVSLITWGHGYAAVALDNGPLWIPERCVR
uniref:RNA-directed DNA polymerase n=1 Tax=Varanus komodoensis TaxID=61221 RepID=A0A8D2IRU6_VARKO